ncbi:MAG TPA: UvrD-helicase domain-containing protein [Trueperaceae bacterium]
MSLPSPAPAAGPPLSHYQERIIEFVTSGQGNGVVRATAGAGKTSTLVAVASNLDPASRACFLAFGREAAAELARRLPPWVAAMTVHSLGRSTVERSLRSSGRRMQAVEKGKYRRLLRRALKERPGSSGLAPEQVAGCEEYLNRVVGLVRLHLVEPGDDGALRALVEHHAIVPPEPELEPASHRLLWKVLEQGLDEALELGICDFTDMLYLPVTQELDPPRFDFVCVDEAQDYSAAALAFTRRLVDARSGGRLLFVGDPRQSIYGFAGADSEAMDRIVAETKATVLPLSITYRCPRSHVALARLLAPEIEAGPSANEGRVFWIADRALEHWAREGDMVICRANAPLVKTCLRLARAGLRAFVRGRDLRKQLLELSERAVAGRSRDPRDELDAFEARETARLQRLAGRRAEPLVEARRDLVDCLRFLLANPRSGDAVGLRELQRRIEETFAQQEGAVILSTVHRAKGLESDRVLLLYPELMPAPYARTARSLRGEAAVQFVALTRARHDLVFVSNASAQASRAVSKDGMRSGPVGSRSPPATADPDRAPPATSLDPVGVELAPEDLTGQGKGVWREVLELARLLSRTRG